MYRFLGRTVGTTRSLNLIPRLSGGLRFLGSVTPSLLKFSSLSSALSPSLLPSSNPSLSSSSSPDLSLLKLNSNGSQDLYAIFKLHNMPYLVTKGDKIYLPFKLKKALVGDELILNNVTTLGAPEFTYNDDNGIPPLAYDLRASVVEITREPCYQVYRKKQRCRRLKTFKVEPHQTVLMINELSLK